MLVVDLFVIVCVKVCLGMVVMEEGWLYVGDGFVFKLYVVKIFNVCVYFEILCIDFEEFMY